VVVDARGRRCPLPVIDLARRLPEVEVGGVVELLADDPAADTDVPAWCRMRGQSYLGREQRDAATAHRVRRER
jgi:tRNA 2-thiouridine synthesizing protein A